MVYVYKSRSQTPSRLARSGNSVFGTGEEMKSLKERLELAAKTIDGHCNFATLAEVRAFQFGAQWRDRDLREVLGLDEDEDLESFLLLVKQEIDKAKAFIKIIDEVKP
jgi:hypothetical protein